MKRSRQTKLPTKEYRILLAQVVSNLRLKDEHGIDRYPEVVFEGRYLLDQCGITELRVAKSRKSTD